MTWDSYYRGTGEPHDVVLPDPPPWRTFPRRSAPRTFRPPKGLTDAVNAAVFLHRPLLITGPAGSGKSTVIEQVADELRLGPVLRWHITSRSTLTDGLYRYDALGHIHALRLAQSAQHQLPPEGGHSTSVPGGGARKAAGIAGVDVATAGVDVAAMGVDVATAGVDVTAGVGAAAEVGATAAPGADTGPSDIAAFLQLGPLGTALLPDTERPRALLIDEIDKSDLDLPSDLLDVLERGVFEIPELVRHSNPVVPVRRWRGDGEGDRSAPGTDGDGEAAADDPGGVPLTPYEVREGRVQCERFPFIVMTSNGEREFPAPFLRRCIRYDMPPLSVELLHSAVEAHIGQAVTEEANKLIRDFVDRVARGEALAVDQLLNAVKLVTDDRGPTGEQRDRLIGYLLRNLSGI